MRIDQRRNQELARRKGFARRTVVQSIWLLISAVATYFFVRYLMANDYLSYDVFYNRLLIPQWVPEWGILLALVLAGVILLQFFFFLAFALVRPEGRAQTGRATAFSRNRDPLDDERRY
jgi:hypothetical protein